MIKTLTFLQRNGTRVRKIAVSLLLAVFLIYGTIASLQTGLTSDEPVEQGTFDLNLAAVTGLFLGQPEKFNELQSYRDRYYGIGFHALAYPFQILLQSHLERTLGVSGEAAFLLAKHPVVFVLFVISVVVFYRFVRFFIRERFIAVAISAAYAAYPYLFGHAMMNVKDSPFMSVYLVCTYLSVRLVRHRLQGKTSAFRLDAAELLLATAALTSIRIAGLLILLQYTFTFGLADYRAWSTGAPTTRLCRWQNLAGFALLLVAMLVIAYPVFWTSPARQISAAINYMGWIDQPGDTLTWGQWFDHLATPTYLSGWLIVKLPVLILVGLSFVPFVLKRVVRHPFQRLAYLTLLIGGLYPLITVVVLRAHLYDETRQVLFVYPLLFLLAAVALYVASRKVALTAALLSLAIFTWDHVRLHPYQYVYFNEITRFLRIDDLFETDYWGSSAREQAKALEHDPHVGKDLACLFAYPADIYRPFVDPRVCVQDLSIAEQNPPNNFVYTMSCFPKRVIVPANCRGLSTISRTLPLSNRTITMSVAFYCSQ